MEKSLKAGVGMAWLLPDFRERKMVTGLRRRAWLLCQQEEICRQEGFKKCHSSARDGRESNFDHHLVAGSFQSLK